MRSYFTLCWRKSPVPFDELRILGDVHRPLRAQILSHVGASMRAELPILQVLVNQDTILHDITLMYMVLHDITGTR